MKKIFIACPISKYLNKNEFTNRDFKEYIQGIHSICKRYTDNVFFALEREKFGLNRMEDHVCTKLDYYEMIDSDIVVVIPEDSQGVAVEVGWASAMKKNIIMILDECFSTSPLINAINEVTDAKVIKTSSNNGYSVAKEFVYEELKKQLSMIEF